MGKAVAEYNAKEIAHKRSMASLTRKMAIEIIAEILSISEENAADLVFLSKVDRLWTVTTFTWSFAAPGEFPCYNSKEPWQITLSITNEGEWSIRIFHNNEETERGELSVAPLYSSEFLQEIKSWFNG